jgi:hypothetical protein
MRGYATVRNSSALYGRLQRVIPLAAWRGRRLSVSLRLKNDGDARAWAMLQMTQRGRITIAAPQRNAPGNGGWETRRFVLNVSDSADALILNVGLTDQGKVWLDSLTLEAVGADVAVTESHVRNVPLCCDGEWGLGWNGGYVDEPKGNTSFPNSDHTEYGH